MPFDLFGLRLRLVFLYGFLPVVILEDRNMSERVHGGTIDVCPLCANGRLFTPDDMAARR